jgi:hypothetical protein
MWGAGEDSGCGCGASPAAKRKERFMDSKRKVPYAKQKITLYFDENMPAVVVEHFRTSSYWRKKVKVVSAGEEANSGRSDEFQFRYCSRKGYVLVSLDGDFNDDQRYGLHPVWMTRS